LIEVNQLNPLKKEYFEKLKYGMRFILTTKDIKT